jgi:hypothetical protein
MERLEERENKAATYICATRFFQNTVGQNPHMGPSHLVFGSFEGRANELERRGRGSLHDRKFLLDLSSSERSIFLSFCNRKIGWGVERRNEASTWKTFSSFFFMLSNGEM